LSEQESAKLLFQILGIYLGVGIACLAILDYLTGRIRKGMDSAVFQVASLMQAGERVAIIITVVFLWLFWPAAVYGALERWWKDNHTTEEKNDKTGKEN